MPKAPHCFPSFRVCIPPAQTTSASHLHVQRWVQNHGKFVVHANEVLERYEQLPVLVRSRYLFQLLGEHRPKYVVGEVETSDQPVQLARLELTHLGYLAGVEEELHKLTLRKRGFMAVGFKRYIIFFG